MLRSRLFKILTLTIVIFASIAFECFAVGEGVEDHASSSSPEVQSHYQVETTHLEPRERSELINRLKQRFLDLNLPQDLQVSEIKLSHTEIEDQLEGLRRQLNTDGDRKSLEYLDMTQDRWKAHALILRDAAHDSPNIAILTTPNHWKSLTEKIRLHAFARVEGIDIDALHKELDRDYNYNPINSLARYILPKTPESEFRSLLPRFPL